jgi:quaternary ammonium compound-resistance protein SugE
MAWFILFLAGLFEVAWAGGMKASNGFTRMGPSVFTLVTLAASMGLLAASLKTIPISIAYPVWTGVGAVGTVIVGAMFFREEMSISRAIYVLFILIGIIGLRTTHE